MFNKNKKQERNLEMKRLLALIMASCMLLALLTACGNSSSPSETGSQAPQSSAPQSSAPVADGSPISDELKATDLYARMTTAATEYDEIISTGPTGETAVHADTLALSEDEINQIRAGGYKAAICLHYGGNDWSTSQVAGLTDAFEILGIEIVAVTDANFSVEQQVSDLETVMALNPDIIVSIPTDATATADAYRRVAEAGIKLVFMDNVAAGMTAGTDYVSCVSADNYGNGVIAADLIGEALNGEGQIATVFYDTDFFVTNQRYDAFKTTMAEKYPGIEIVSEQGFLDEGTCNIQGDAIMTQYPDIDAIFCHWDIPCEGVLSSVRAAGKSPLLSTIDLGNNIALEIASGNVLGLGAQRPYDQGVAEAMCAAYSLLGKEAPAYVAVAALRVDQSNILEAYSEVYYVDAPDWLVEAYEANQG